MEDKKILLVDFQQWLYKQPNNGKNINTQEILSKYIFSLPNIEWPKYKIWDNVVYKDEEEIVYIKICEISKERDWTFKYNSNITSWYLEQQLREPTQEELNLYFK